MPSGSYKVQRVKSSYKARNERQRIQYYESFTGHVGNRETKILGLRTRE